MVGQKVFKTRICILYTKGRCHRQTCSFAHGDSELRRYNPSSSSSSFNGRRDYRSDLRDKLGRQWSPPRRNSLDRDARDSRQSPRFEKKSDWDHRKRQRFDGENNYSGNSRLADGADRQARDRKPSSSELNDIHDEQLKQLQSEIDMLEDNKQQLQIYLEESEKEVDSLNSKIQDLEMQLSAEKDECKRISSKVRKFVKANNKHARIQEELKRSQARLQRLADELALDARAAANEDDINISMLSDEETNLVMSPKIYKASPKQIETYANHLTAPQKDQYNDQYNASPSKKRMRLPIREADERSKQAGGFATREWARFGNTRTERHSRRDPHLAETKNTGELRADNNGISNARPSVNDDKSIRRKSNFNSSPGKKYKDLKSTSMAANVVDEVVEEVELNEKLGTEETTSTHGNTALPLPPPPPILPNSYLQYQEKNESVVHDNDDVDDDELDVDIV